MPLQFKPHLSIKFIEGNGVLIRTESSSRLLHGALETRIARLLFEHREHGIEPDAIAEGLAGEFDAARVYFTITRLEQKGYLCQPCPGIPPGECAFWWEYDIDPAAAHKALQGATYSLHTFGNVRAAGFHSALKELGLRDDPAADLKIVLAEEYRDPALEELARRCFAEGKRWMLFRPAGRQVWIGPYFHAESAACGKCMQTRLVENLGDTAPTALAQFSPSIHLAESMAALEIALLIVRGSSPLDGRLLAIDTVNWQTSRHTVIRDPACPVCASRYAAKIPQPLVLQSRPLTSTEGNGHRSSTSEETLARFAHLMSHLTSPIREPLRVIGNHDASHVYLAGTNRAMACRNLDQLRKNLRANSAGKGSTDIQAKVGALCEAVERLSSEATGTETRIRSTYRDAARLLPGKAWHPHGILFFSDAQYANREQAPEGFNHVPAPFDETIERDWTPVWSLTRQAFDYFPTGQCYYGGPAAKNDETDAQLFACSNGCASGNNLEEAILQGFFELVERDAVAIWWYNRLTRPRLDLDSFENPYYERLRRELNRLGREYWVLDLTHDLGLPVFVSISRRTQHTDERMIFGFGCHFDPAVAALRSVTEMNQLLSNVLYEEQTGGKDAQKWDDETSRWLASATLADHPYLAPSDQTRQRADFTDLSTGDLRDDVLLAQRIVEKHGMEMLVLDQTRAELGMPVVKVFVPGLRHFWRRLAPGRLYDVPVRLGWLKTPRREEEMNPVGMFL